MTDMVAAYSVKPQVLTTAQEVLDRAARVRAFRSISVKSTIEPAKSPQVIHWPTIRFLGQCMNDYANYAGSKRTKQWVPGRQISIKEIQVAVCRKFKIKLVDLVSHRRSPEVCIPRHIAIWIARKATTRSYPEICRQFGGRDHSTGINAFEKIERLRLAGDPLVCEAIHRLVTTLDIAEILSEGEYSPR